MADLLLRPVTDDDVLQFFRHLQDHEAIRMAAFTPKDPADRAAHVAHWTKIRGAPGITTRTIVLGDAVAGHVASFGQPLEVTYWIAREHWGKGVATRALATFLREVVTERPVEARVAKDNAASIRVLEKCGFEVKGYDRYFAHGRGEEIDEVVLCLR